MKIRNDFVTNSSSSSFIIGKVGDTDVTVQSVYEIVRGLYLELGEIKKEVIEYFNSHPEYKYAYSDETGDFEWTDEYLKNLDEEFTRVVQSREEYDRNKFKDVWEASNKVDEIVRNKFGLDDICEVNYEEDFMQYENYKDAVENCYLVFRIEDFSDEHSRQNVKSRDVGCNNGLFDELFDADYEEYKDYAELLNWYGDGNVYNIVRKIRYKDKVEDKSKVLRQLCLNVLGKVCVFSYCGRMPNYVVDKLSEISTLACNHMG